MKRFEPLVQRLASDPDQSRLLALLLDDCYQKNLNPVSFMPAGLPRGARETNESSRSRSRGERRPATSGPRGEERKGEEKKREQGPRGQKRGDFRGGRRSSRKKAE